MTAYPPDCQTRADLLTRIGDRRVILSVSGGKDSAAAGLYLSELAIEYDRVHLLTGWDSQVTLDYIRGPLTEKLGPITEVRGQRSMEELIEHKGMFLAPNPLYLNGLSRVGCWPCIYARKEEIRLIAEVDYGRIVRIRQIEARTHEAARTRWEARRDAWRELPIDERVNRRAPSIPLLPRGLRRVRGSKPISLGVSPDSSGAGRPPKAYRRPAFFQSALREEGGACWPIDRVVEWSRTLRGGRVENKQAELFAGINDGCMRWGLCETEPGA